MFDRVIADRAEIQSLAHGAVDMVHLEGFQQPQDLDVFPLARFAHPGLQQPAQRGERVWQIPTLQRRSLIQSADLLLRQWQEMHGIEDYVGLVIGPLVPGDHLPAAADDDLMDIAALFPVSTYGTDLRL